MRKNSNTLEDCKAKASYLSTLKANKDETFHIIKADKHFIVSNDKAKQAQFESAGAYWVVRKSYYNSLQGNIVVSFKRGKKIEYHAPKPASGSNQTKADI